MGKKVCVVIGVAVSEVVLVVKCNGVSAGSEVEDVAIETSCDVDASKQPKRISIASKTKDKTCFIAACLFC